MRSGKSKICKEIILKTRNRVGGLESAQVPVLAEDCVHGVICMGVMRFMWCKCNKGCDSNSELGWSWSANVTRVLQDVTTHPKPPKFSIAEESKWTPADEEKNSTHLKSVKNWRHNVTCAQLVQVISDSLL